MDSAGIPATAWTQPQGTHRIADPGDPPRELSGLAWGVYVSFGLLAILALVRITAALHLHSTASKGGDLLGAYHSYDKWVGLYAIVFVLCAGVFIAWFFRAYSNLRRLGVQNLRYGKGWAIGAWFVPILSLVRPKHIANDIWRGSEPGADVAARWHQVSVPGLVHWWWAMFLIQGFFTYGGQRATQSGYYDLGSFYGLEHGLSQIKTGTVLDVFGEVCAIVGVVLAVKLVSRVTERLDGLRALALTGLSPAASSYPPPNSYPPPPSAR
jgi:eukaryotic-like serine/threonine-protein kinase